MEVLLESFVSVIATSWSIDCLEMYGKQPQTCIRKSTAGCIEGDV